MERKLLMHIGILGFSLMLAVYLTGPSWAENNRGIRVGPPSIASPYSPGDPEDEKPKEPEEVKEEQAKAQAAATASVGANNIKLILLKPQPLFTSELLDAPENATSTNSTEEDATEGRFTADEEE